MVIKRVAIPRKNQETDENFLQDVENIYVVNLFHVNDEQNSQSRYETQAETF